MPPSIWELRGVIEINANIAVATQALIVNLTAAAYEDAEEIVARAKERVPVDMGALRASGTVLTPQVRGNTVFVELGFGGAAAPYAVVVHEGRRAGSRMPPVPVIKEWVRRHGMPEEAAYPVAQAIARRGIPPTKFLEQPFLEALPDVRRHIETVVRQTLGD